MATRITECVVRGELDNRKPGHVTGSLWLSGSETCVIIDLEGNFLKDMAGCLIKFVNPSPRTVEILAISPFQAGCVGDMTASRKVTVFDVSDEEAASLRKNKQDIPTHVANCLYLEWFGSENGRVVIESTDFQVTVSEPVWSMDNKLLEQQVDQNKEAFKEWLQRMDDLEGEDDPEELASQEEEPLDEFEWEQVMRESDKRAEKLDEILAKYEGHPDSDKLIAREMGWTWLEDELEAQERGIVTFSEADSEEAEEIVEPPPPNPLTQGVNWVYDEDGNVNHPHALRAVQIGRKLNQYLDASSHGSNADVQGAREMLLYIQLASVKLAGVLNHLAYEDVEIDHGFIVAGLKRGLHFLHKAIHAGLSAGARKAIDPATRQSFQQELFALREDIVNMMNRYRNEPL